jgi:DNA-binding GntR family transcriptional regulator
MATRSLLGENDSATSTEALFTQLASILREKIYSHEWQSGSRIPSEHDLMREFGLSRGTVRRAIGVLIEEGRLVQRRGKGTFVTGPGISHPAGVRPISFAESLRRQGKDFVTHVLTKEVTAAPESVANALDIKVGDPVMYMRRVRTVEGVPVICQESWTNLSECKGIEDMDFTQVSLFDAVERTSKRKVKYSVMKYEALVAGHEHGALLRCDENTAVLHLEQVIHLEDDAKIEWSVTWLTPGQSIVGTAYQPES